MNEDDSNSFFSLEIQNINEKVVLKEEWPILKENNLCSCTLLSQNIWNL